MTEFLEKLEVILRDLKRYGIDGQLTFLPEYIEFRASMIGAGGKHYGNDKRIGWPDVEHAQFDILEKTIVEAVHELKISASMLSAEPAPNLCGCGSGPPHYTLPPAQVASPVPDNPEWAGDYNFGELS